MALLNVENLSFTYAGKEQPVLQGISFSVEKGQLVAVCGPTGSGKSSLLRLLKRELTPLGQKTGRILFENVPLENLSDREAAFRIGYVMQRPEEQIVTDKVWHELAFGLENMNVPQSVIARRIAEIAVYFGIEDWYDKPVSQLSGGQKQMLNLAAVMVLQPEVLILDEPTAQLDPVAASRFIQTLYKLNRELGLTVIIAEHRLEEIIPCCDRMLALEKGSMICYDTPQSVAAGLDKNLDLLCTMPAATRIYHLLEAKGDCPLDVRQGREFIQKRFSNNTRSLPEEKTAAESKAALEFEDVFFRYERNSPDVLKGLSFTAREKEIYCILGQNASGKTTMLSVAAGINRAYSGKVKVFGKQIKEYKNQSLYRECLTLLPQDVQTMFLRNTVGEELDNAREGLELLPFDISHLFGQHPYDLSGGEQQLAALAKALATKPKLLLMDEPTKGIDAAAKEKLVKVLKNLKERGMTIVVVTHDVEFAAACADRCAMFFRGSIVSEGTPRNFFHENHFFTTAISRMTRGYFDYAVTAEDAFALCRINGEKGGKE